ncbi:MAG: hypothetical protein QOG55_1265 [Acidobacteriaceae bacterium]|jgi:hypothetical protein|nr:hypothetical protein [Acidobacteriaceae bacterium]
MVPKPAEKAVTLMKYRVVGSRLNKNLTQNIFIAGLVTAVFGFLSVGCGTETPKPSSEPAAQAKPAEPAIPDDIQDAARHLLGSDAQVLLVGDLAKNGKRQFLAANVIPKTPQNNVPGTVVTRAIVAQDDDGKWTELLRVDEHLKNQKGYLGLTPLDSINGWRLQYERNPEKGLQLYFTPLKVNGDTHVLTIGVRWNPATNRYQSLDSNYEHFLKESTSLQNVRSSLR